MSDVPLSIPNSSSWPQPRNDKTGCWSCRFRKKGCKPGSRGPEGPCRDCEVFNIRCFGQGVDRPSGSDVAEHVRALVKDWLGDRSNRGPSVPPLDLTRVMPSPWSSPVVNSANHQHSDGPPSPLFLEVEARNSHQDNTLGPAPSHSHGAIIYPLDTEALWNDTQYAYHIYDLPSSWTEYTDHVTSTPFSLFHDENVPSFWSEGVYPFSALGSLPSEACLTADFLTVEDLQSPNVPSKAFVTPEDFQSPNVPNDGMGLPWGSHRAHR